ncbi:putative ABC transport system ATP-binding protein [Solibacillus kalamii]|uniref:Lipoprotein-releasing system ATP-binding protein LolD n=2 Tax=Solibacillus TaxID=648800 RepID=K1KML6_9BACL|nr:MULTISPECIES: ABC transporter ATP-binding protein [Solibacillus]AMO87248.1 hemin ABC transporter ATP-binding protein [Solibacillus silvestris]EKB45340.1 Lipoprotein-releasing system ATP-binding protein LolD [Solibacillus isronensis B3W22]MBM7666304.1 putative ABC transport system ATP-binding protein [Solibacillus kalamii]OBW59461.1 hemin ABC transporter ATP-binding protein [Solibacillus silvestris]OUZ38105.1 hemin ABC transporter ATP-binding protein [Solibacillus kalamii]
MTGLVLKNVTKSFKEGDSTVDALKNVSLTVNPGEFIAIIGPSGSGKSTLLSIAGALLQPSTGEVLVNGTNIGKMKEKDLSAFRLTDVGFILQTSNLIPYLTVLDQLLLVRKMKGKVSAEDTKFAKTLLTELGLGDKFNKFPNELSGGERQRVAIARAFVNNSNIILADEPTASLDSKRAFEVVKQIRKEVKERNKAAVMVTHDERMLEFCDKVYRMEDGLLTLEG